MTVTAIVTLGDVEAHLNLTDSSQDGEVQGFIDAATAVVEQIVGVVVPKTFDEWYPGGAAVLIPRHRPILTVSSLVEYRGLTPYTLTAAATPAAASTYSYQLDASGAILRRGGGGAPVHFPDGDDTVHLVYTAGRSTVPGNIRLGTLEIIRHLWDQTQQGGRPSFGSSTASDDVDGYSAGYAVPNRALELLQGHKRAPRIA